MKGLLFKLFTAIKLIAYSFMAYADRYGIHDPDYENYGHSSGHSRWGILFVIIYMGLWLKWPLHMFCLSGVVAGISMIYFYDGWIIGTLFAGIGGYGFIYLLK